MEHLIISSYPPMACGIGTYAEQQAAALRKQGHVVNVLSPPEADSDFHVNLCGGLRPLRLLRFAWAYDRIHLHFTPSFYFSPDRPYSRLLTSLSLLIVMLLQGRKFNIVVHETEYRIDEDAVANSLRARIDGISWRLCQNVTFHSAREQAAFEKYYRLARGWDQAIIQAHDRDFVRYCELSREEAREKLQLDQEAFLFLCIGFIQPHKGFDRAISAMRHITREDVLLRIVGSVRICWQPAIDYAAALHKRVEHDPRCDFIESFVPREDFDAWIVASDCVIVPYFEIWSSGVAARAKLYGRPVIASDAGGLLEQMSFGSQSFSTEEELLVAMNQTVIEFAGDHDHLRFRAHHAIFDQGVGWEEPETHPPDLTSLRWTIGPCQELELPPPRDSGNYRIQMTIWRPQPFPTETIVLACRIDGEPFRSFELKPGKSKLEFVRSLKSDVPLSLKFKSPTWKPSDFIPDSDDDRELSFLISHIEINPVQDDSKRDS